MLQQRKQATKAIPAEINKHLRYGNMNKTHFGYQTVDEVEKAGKVADVFHSVANKYDVMNDLMSFGLHRIWKKLTIARAQVRPGQRILDIAGGTGDLACCICNCCGVGQASRCRGLAQRHQRIHVGGGARSPDGPRHGFALRAI